MTSDSIAPLIDANMGFQYRNTSREAICLSVAVALHALMFLWNPIILKGAMEKAQNPLVEIGIVDEAETAAPAEAPKKLSLMETLKDMLTKPEPAAPHIDTPKQMPVQTPLLQDRSMPRPIMNVLHTQSADQLAMANTPTPISTQKNFKLPDAAPSLQSKSFSGVRARDLPFETSNETIATAGQAIPISVGNNSSKAALSYVNPSLRDNSRTSLQSKKFFGTTSPDAVGFNAAATPIQISGNAPSIAPTNNAPALRETHTSNANLFDRSLGGHTATPALQTLPNSGASQTDVIQDHSSSSNHIKKNGFEIEGKLANRTILKKVIPQYPSWAEEQGIIGTLRLYFTVTPDGAIRPNIKVTKTTGNPQLDQVGIDALKEWLFAPQPSATDDDVQWGIITFTFSLAS